MRSVKIAVSGWYGRRNLGDELMLDAILHELHAQGATPIVLSAETDRTRRRHPGVRVVPNNTPIQRFRAFRAADGVLLGGGGLIKNLAPTASGAGPFLDLVLASSANRPSLYFGISFDRVSVPVHARSAQVLLRAARGAVVRDHISAEALHELGMPRSSITVGVDPVLLDAQRAPATTTHDFAAAVIVSRHALDHAGRRLGEGATAKLQQVLVDVVANRSRQRDLPVLLPVFCRERSADDLALAHDLVARLKCLGIRTQIEDVSDATRQAVTELLARTEAVVSMRFHGCLLAQLAGTKVVALGLEQKTRGLTSASYVAPPTVSAEDLLRLLEARPRDKDRMTTTAEATATRNALRSFVQQSKGSHHPVARFSAPATFVWRRLLEHRAGRRA